MPISIHVSVKARMSNLIKATAALTSSILVADCDNCNSRDEGPGAEMEMEL